VAALVNAIFAWTDAEQNVEEQPVAKADAPLFFV
jgi:hypothetical protein